MSSDAEPVLDELENLEEANENVGQTSEETATATSSRSSSRLGFLSSMTIYDTMLVASALSVSVAIVLMVMELSSFDGLFFQWRTTEAEVSPITLP